MCCLSGWYVLLFKDSMYNIKGSHKNGEFQVHKSLQFGFEALFDV